MFMNVDLPEPDAPMMATNSPAPMSQRHAAQRLRPRRRRGRRPSRGRGPRSSGGSCACSPGIKTQCVGSTRRISDSHRSLLAPLRRACGPVRKRMRLRPTASLRDCVAHHRLSRRRLRHLGELLVAQAGRISTRWRSFRRRRGARRPICPPVSTRRCRRRCVLRGARRIEARARRGTRSTSSRARW